MGSHLDSVATGGMFDGPLGVNHLLLFLLAENAANTLIRQVLGALEVIRSMKEQDVKTNAPLVLITGQAKKELASSHFWAVHVFTPDNQLSKKLTHLSRPATPP
jgi:hypothetical protein